MRLPWVSRLAFDEVVKQRDGLLERNDRLVEAISQSESRAPVVMPRQPVILERGSGWFDSIRNVVAATPIKEN